MYQLHMFYNFIYYVQLYNQKYWKIWGGSGGVDMNI